MKEEVSNKFQTLVVYKINPNEKDINGEVDFSRSSDGRIFASCRYFIQDHAIIVENEKEKIEGIFSLHHYFLLEQD